MPGFLTSTGYWRLQGIDLRSTLKTRLPVCRTALVFEKPNEVMGPTLSDEKYLLAFRYGRDVLLYL